MKIASPLSRVKETAPLAKAGADEFYCCVAPQSWQSSYSMVESISRRNNPFAHLKSYFELEKIVKTAAKYKVKIHVALNESYHRDQISYLKEQLKILESIGVDGVILGDLAALLVFKETGVNVKVFMGTGGTIFNSETVKFYHSLGAERMILPRHLSIDEIKNIVESAPNCQYEVFIFRGLCPYIDGFCRFQHGINESLGKKPRVDLACTLRFRAKSVTEKQSSLPGEVVKEIKKGLSARQQLTGCGLCALWELSRIKNIEALKIVGREFSSAEKLANLKLVKKMLTVVEKTPPCSKEEFLHQCKEEFSLFFDRPCGHKDCYYPEVCR